MLIFREVRRLVDTGNLPRIYYSHQLIDFCRTFAATNNFKQKNMKKLFLLASFLMAIGISADAGDITSPNGQIKVNFTLDGTVPTYSVTYQVRPLSSLAVWVISSLRAVRMARTCLLILASSMRKLLLSTRLGLQFGERTSQSAIIIMICW